MVSYCTAWTKSEIYNSAINEPTDGKLHIPDSGGMRTYCNRVVAPGKLQHGNPEQKKVCTACVNGQKRAVNYAPRKLRHLD